MKDHDRATLITIHGDSLFLVRAPGRDKSSCSRSSPSICSHHVDFAGARMCYTWGRRILASPSVTWDRSLYAYPSVKVRFADGQVRWRLLPEQRARDPGKRLSCKPGFRQPQVISLIGGNAGTTRFDHGKSAWFIDCRSVAGVRGPTVQVVCRLNVPGIIIGRRVLTLPGTVVSSATSIGPLASASSCQRSFGAANFTGGGRCVFSPNWLGSIYRAAVCASS